jgi:glycosyltransferase involved in cell wall biosynthesis
MSGRLKFTVIQVGARLHYAVPSILADAGMLQALYTDACESSLGVRLLNRTPAALKPRALRRLAARKVPANLQRELVWSFWRPSLQQAWFNWWNRADEKSARVAYEKGIGGHWLAHRAIGESFRGANALYVHPCSSTDAIIEAKKRGMFVALEAISHPLNKLVEAEEYERFGLPLLPNQRENADNIAFFKEEALLADVILSASPYVREGLIGLGLDPKRVVVVPYGLDAGFFDEEPAPRPGRVLYVGNIGYLKGVPYLSEAARQLKRDGFKGEVRAVGPHDGKLIHRPEFTGPNYLGPIPRSEVQREFLSADIFVFPTLSDGFGLVLLEAMAAGLPVICTPNCGDVVRHGENGFVVPIRDALALADAVKRLVNDRRLRDDMGGRARETAARYSLRHYGSRLFAALNVYR